MNIRDIEYFVALAEHGSFKMAAMHCNTTQPTISNSILRLERELGASLFKRTTRSVSLTYRGLQILEYAHSVLVNVNTIKDIANSMDFSSKIINLGVSTSLSYYFYERISFSLPNIINQNLSVHEIATGDIKAKLDSGFIDCMLLSYDEDIYAYDKFLISEFPFFLGVSLDDEFVNHENISPTLLKSRNVLVTQDNNPYDTSLKKFLQNYDLNYNQDLLFNSVEIVKMAIKSRKGVGLIPEYAVSEHESIKYLSFSECGVKRKIFIVFRKNDPYIEQYKNISAGLKKILVALK